MPLSQPKQIFGVHSLTPYSRTTGIPFGYFRVIGSASMNFTGETVDLNGGSSKFPWAVERGLITPEVSLTLREYPDMIHEIFFGKAATVNAAEATGNVSTLANKNGLTLQDAVTGIATVTATAAAEADLKFGTYVVEAVSPTTVDVYAYTDVNFANGALGEYLDDSLKIASGLTITTSGTTTLADFGFELTGGSGTIALTIGDTATFAVRPINDGSTIVTHGSNTAKFNNFGLVVEAEQSGSGRLVEIDLFNVTAIGAPINMTEVAFSEYEVTLKPQQCASEGGVFSFKYIESLSTC